MRALLASLLLASLAAAVGAWRLLVPRPQVLIGATFARGSDAGDVVLRAGQPIRVMLAMPPEFGADGLVDLDLHRLGEDDRVLQVIPLRASARDDQVVFA